MVVAKRLVEEAVVANIVVDVAFVVVEFNPVKFCKVLDPVARMLAAVRREDTKELVAERVAEKKLVEVELVVVD